jgi:hypothetical protein
VVTYVRVWAVSHEDESVVWDWCVGCVYSEQAREEAKASVEVQAAAKDRVVQRLHVVEWMQPTSR